MRKAAGPALNRRMMLKVAALGMTGLAAPTAIGRAAGGMLSWRDGDPFSLSPSAGSRLSAAPRGVVENRRCPPTGS